MAKRHTFLAITLLGLLTILFLNRDLFPDSGEALGTHDTRALFYPWLSTMREAVWEGRLPIWEPDHFNGYPFISNPQVAFFYPPTALWAQDGWVPSLQQLPLLSVDMWLLDCGLGTSVL
jgi:hypothetical protein